MAKSHFDTDEPEFDGAQLDLATTGSFKSKARRTSRNRWTPEEIDMQEISAQCSPCDDSHPYLVHHGLELPHGHFFDGTDIAGIPCQGAYVEFIHDRHHKVVNAMFKVQHASGHFEDLLVPGKPIAGCWSRIGESTTTKIVAVDHASALAIHEATGLCVAVVHYHQNLSDVCRWLREACPHDNIVIAFGLLPNENLTQVKNMVLAAAQISQASIAVPDGPSTFAALSRSHGPLAVKSCIDGARQLPEDWVPTTDDSAATPLAWPNPVHPGGLLAMMCAHLSRYTVLPFSSIYAIALWIIATHLVAIFDTAPVLALLSLTKRCGKTVTFSAISALVHRFKPTSHTTAAALVEMCDGGFTPGIDEADQLLPKRADQLNSVVNSGHTRIASKVTRKGATYNTFGFKLIAGIGSLPSTIEDRSVVIVMVRKSPREKVERYKAEANGQAVVLRAMIETFASHHRTAIQHGSPDEPEMENDRALDNWRPLFAIADCAGRQWLDNAHIAAAELTPGADDIPTILEEFICDVVEIFLRNGADFISTQDLIEKLCENAEKPWATYTRKQRLGIHDLGRLMREAKVRVGEQKHEKGTNCRGYYRAHVAHLFDGYGPTSSQ
jgi:putative DNA primase/helicase